MPNPKPKIARAFFAPCQTSDLHPGAISTICTQMCTLLCTDKGTMTAIKVGVREFRERIASFLESDTPVAVTRHGQTVGIYIPTRRKRPKTAEVADLKAAADRLAKAPIPTKKKSSLSSSNCAATTKNRSRTRDRFGSQHSSSRSARPTGQV